MRRSAKHGGMLTGVFNEQRNADSGDKDGELGTIPQRTVGEKFNQHSDESADGHRQNQNDCTAEIRLRGKKFIHERCEEVSGKRTEHEDITVREVDETQDAVNHRVAQRDERVNRAQRKSVDQLL